MVESINYEGTVRITVVGISRIGTHTIDASDGDDADGQWDESPSPVESTRRPNGTIGATIGNAGRHWPPCTVS